MHIKIVPYRSEWPEVFQHVSVKLKQLLGDVALRVDHIGSTSVPTLPAKNIIDIQITVENLDSVALMQKLEGSSFLLRPELRDQLIGVPEDSLDLKKMFMKIVAGELCRQQCNVHIREHGRLNQRYALLFRDFLRANTAQKDIYALLKQRLAVLFPDSIDDYLHIKDPVMDLIFLNAEAWARETAWTVDHCA